jgi:hypothetical protein
LIATLLQTFYLSLQTLYLSEISANSFSVSCICLRLVMWKTRARKQANEVNESKKTPFEETQGPPTVDFLVNFHRLNFQI